MKSHVLFVILAAGLSTGFGQSESRPSASADVIGPWKSGSVPFHFKYGGRDSSVLIPTWQRLDDTVPAAGGTLHRRTYADPATHLRVVVEIRTFDDFDAVDWVLRFANDGNVDTPILEDIRPLYGTVGCDSPGAILHCAQGSDASIRDFSPRANDLPPGGSVQIGAVTGRSSDSAEAPRASGGSFPFFNLQTGDHGLLGAIGWTGSWSAHFNRNASGKAIDLDAGMARTHLLLHPGETIRTPRILLMNWKGDIAEAQNTWRRLMIARYSPKDAAGQPVSMPICWDTWGTERASAKLAVIRGLRDQRIPADLYWIDAGWYEPISLPPGINFKLDSGWDDHRGDWIVSKALYPGGMRPIGEALKAANIGFLLWIEAETANADSRRFKGNPGFYLRLPHHAVTEDHPAFLNLGNPEAFKSITDQVSGIITDDELTWYRQDFNFMPAAYWAAADAPDRVGMSEIKSIAGLYAYWDELVARHPGLKIDNCASGGRRLDIETMSRSVALWRSDNAGEPIGEQFHSVALMPWIPLTSGVWITLKDSSSPPGTRRQLYEQRSGYCAGMTVCIDQDPAPWVRAAFDEFHEVRPYFLGDFYALLPPTANPGAWAAWQLQKPNRRSGILVALRRPDSPNPTVELNLHALDPGAQYEVEVRTGLERGKVEMMAGRDLARYRLTVSDRPGSALVFYSMR